MATGIHLQNGARWRRRLRWAWAALTVLLVAAVTVPDLASAAPPRRAEPARIQPPVVPGRPRPAAGQQVAASKGERAPRATVTVMVVHANHSGRIDPRLSDPALRRQLSAMSYNGAQVLSSSGSQLAPAQSTSVNVEGGRKIQVTLESKSAEQSRLRIQMFRNGDKKLDTTVSVRAGRTFVVAGPEHQGGVLLFAITVD